MMPLSQFGRVLALFVFSVSWMGALPLEAQHTRTVDRTIELETDAAVELATDRGSIQITGWDRSEVDAQVRIEGPDAQAVQDAGIEVEDEDGNVSIRTSGVDPDGPGLLDLIGLTSSDGVDTHYELRVPKSTSVSVATQSASVEIRGIGVDVSVAGTSSPVRIEDVDGEIRVATFSGSIEVEKTEGDLRLATFSGDLRARLDALPGDSQLASFSGDAEVLLPANAGFDLRTDITFGGEIASEFDLPEASSEGPRSVGGGGPTIAFESFSGSLALRAL